MAIICDICGERVGEGISKAMVLNENTDRWFCLCETCQCFIISYTIKDLPKIRGEQSKNPDLYAKGFNAGYLAACEKIQENLNNSINQHNEE